MTRTVLVIRSSPGKHGVNMKLAAALAPHYVEGVSKVYPLAAGGAISELITNSTYDEICKAVEDADCGDNVLIVDTSAPTFDSATCFGHNSVVTLIPVHQLTKEQIDVEIQALMQLSRVSQLTEEENTRLQELLNHPL